MLWWFYINVTGCVGITGYWSETIFTITLKENIVFVTLLETSFDSNIIASFTEFKCQSTDTFDFIRAQAFEIYVQGNFWRK